MSAPAPGAPWPDDSKVTVSLKEWKRQLNEYAQLREALGELVRSIEDFGSPRRHRPELEKARKVLEGQA